MGNIEIKRGWRDKLEILGGRRADALLVAGIVAAAVLVSAVLWLRHQPAVIAPPATGQAGPGPLTEPSVSPSASLLVDVSGAVHHPGVYGLREGARVQDAIEAAGGALGRADLGALNLAQVLVDGKVDVPRRGEAAGAPSPAAGSTPGAAAPVSVNSADEATLETVPGIGPVTAQKIVDYRATQGGFDSLDQLLDVDGIGPATLEEIRPYISL